ncbi:hypothetical protein KDL01_38760 [Actinospica durhamensis]|uniref:Uncharacterized protein n=1 Tax=Actinospica durhamensis TaxID=1508375 RepID=A0A941EW58_9ACTN|nr:hypothetical protein [Actinospica durhamensis]MBR7839267.1 hypothetical protein [Actinospica durhamensis]
MDGDTGSGPDEPRDRIPEPEAVLDDAGVPRWGADWNQGAAAGWAQASADDTARSARRRWQLYALVAGGAAAAAVAVAAVAVSVTVSGSPAQPVAASATTSSAAAVPGGGAVATTTQAATASQSTPPSGDASQQPSATGDPCLSALSSLSAMASAMSDDNTDSSKSIAAVQLAIDQLEQDASATPSAALKHSLALVVTDLRTLRSAVSSGDLDGQINDLTRIGDDTDTILKSCPL